MSIPVYDLGPGRAKRKADRQAKRATKKAGRKAKREFIASMPGTTKLEKRLNYKGAQARAKATNKQEAKRVKSVTPEQRKAKQNKALADHQARVEKTLKNIGGSKKTTTPTGNTGKKPKLPSYKEAFARMAEHPTGAYRVDKYDNIYENNERGFADFKKAAEKYKADQASAAKFKPPFKKLKFGRRK